MANDTRTLIESPLARPYEWEELPEKARNAVMEQAGTVVKVESCGSGRSPSLAVRLHTRPHRDLFLKAIPVNHPGAALHLREEATNRPLASRDVPAPRMLWSGTVDGWHLMLTEFINDQARHPDLAPGSDDLPAVLDTVALIGTLLTPAPLTSVPIANNTARLVEVARELLDADPCPWQAGTIGPEYGEREMYEWALDKFTPGMLAGATLVHYDLSASNMLIKDGRVWVLDWAWATRAAPWVDYAILAPRLIQAGHTPHQIDDLFAGSSAWKEARTPGLAGLAAAWTLYRVHAALYGPVQHRQSRAQAACAGALWLSYLADSR